MEQYNNCITDKEYLKAKALFERTPSYSDCSDMATKCDLAAKEYIYVMAQKKLDDALEAEISKAIEEFKETVTYKMA
jgi:hypothetical protein